MPANHAAAPAPSPKGLAAVFQVFSENWQTVKVFLLAFLLCAGLVAILLLKYLPSLITAQWVDDRLGLSKHITETVRNEITKRVDSGYSRTFILRPNDRTAENVLPFYAERDQHPMISVESSNSGGDPADVQVAVQIDGGLWKSGDGTFHTPGFVPLKLDPDRQMGNVHDIRFAVKQPPDNGAVIIKCVVLVYNDPKFLP